MAQELLNLETDVTAILRQWEEEQGSSDYDPVPVLVRLCELVEAEAEKYSKMDPDPFDERHPSRSDPNCAFGQMLKILFRKDIFMNKLVNDYLRDNYFSRLNLPHDVRALNTAACRLIIDILPGLETSVVFETPSNGTLVQRLYTWAEKAGEPLQTYAVGLLAPAVEVQEIACTTRENNAKLVPLMLERLSDLYDEAMEEKKRLKEEELAAGVNLSRPFAHFSRADSTEKKESSIGTPSMENKSTQVPPVMCNGFVNGHPKEKNEEPRGRKRKLSNENVIPVKKQSSHYDGEFSNSSWAELETHLIGNVQIHPPSLATKQMFILRYLTPLGEYQEYLTHIVEKNAIPLIMNILDPKNWQNARLTFEALRFLAAILCHKKFALEFISMRGLQKLLEVPRIGMPATGVSLCFFYLAHCEDAMEKVCLLPSNVVTKLIRYALWLLECSYDSGRCHATMFFGLSFQFRVILKEFDEADGLRKIYNVLSTLPLLASGENRRNDDEECSVRQIVRHVCSALKRYFEAHLYIKAESVRRSVFRDSLPNERGKNLILPCYKACKSSPEETRTEINTLLDYMSSKSRWQPVHEFLALGGVNLMLKIINFTYDWNYSGRAETVRGAVDVLNICSVLPAVQLQLCEKVDFDENMKSPGLAIILSAAEGEIVSDTEVQKAALNVIITCACAPVSKEISTACTYSTTPKKRYLKTISGQEILQKVWDSIRMSNGIMILISLMQIKVPITEADSIRALACQALAGLARNETVRQIISKLPLFTAAQLESLMNEPILHEKRQEHVKFQKYAMELVEKVSGKRTIGSQMEASLANMHKANVVAQTKIQYNQSQLLQIIHQHLMKVGLTESANVLQRESNITPLKSLLPNPVQSPFAYKTNKGRFLCGSGLSNETKPKKSLFDIQNNADVQPSCSRTSLSSTPIKINIKRPDVGRQPTLMPIKHHPKSSRMEIANHNTLDSIVREYLINQHTLCKTPMITCPEFNLLEPHKCTNPKPKKVLYQNFTMRWSKGIHSRRLDDRFVHSKFCPVKAFRTTDDDSYFTCAEFISDRILLAGNHTGYVKALNLHTGAELASTMCHHSYVSGLTVSPSGRLIATSTMWRNPYSAIWEINDENKLDCLFSYNDIEVFEFSNLNDERLLGTRNVGAVVYDATTGKKIIDLSPTQSNQYNKNRATFNSTDELVLSDGVLWDVTSGKEIHKFDKLNQTISGVFHPNALEILSNTEVWDIRTFHLLKTVPSLDQCIVKFTNTGRALYAYTVERITEKDDPYDTSFKTLDAFDYSNISTYDVKRSIYHLGCNRYDTQLCVVENFGQFEEIGESVVRIYDVGRSKMEDDEAVNEDVDDDEEEDDDVVNSDGSSEETDQENDNAENEDDDDDEEFMLPENSSSDEEEEDSSEESESDS